MPPGLLVSLRCFIFYGLQSILSAFCKLGRIGSIKNIYRLLLLYRQKLAISTDLLELAVPKIYWSIHFFAIAEPQLIAADEPRSWGVDLHRGEPRTDWQLL